jgi:hypothetical protein
MFMMELTDEDIKWVQTKYPGLAVTWEDGNQVLSGEFHFDAIHQDERISDVYDVRIELQVGPYSDLPQVYETGSRIKKVSEDRSIPLADLHAYEDGSVCLCVKLAEPGYFPDGFSFQIFIEELVVPFFYAQSFFEEHNRWPWEAYSHGTFGWLEWYYDQDETSEAITNDFIEKLKSTNFWEVIESELSRNRVLKGHHECICGSRNRYRKCHQKVFGGLWRLQGDIKRFGLLI